MNELVVRCSCYIEPIHSEMALNTLPVLVIMFVCSAVPGRAETAQIAAAVEGFATGRSRCQSRE